MDNKEVKTIEPNEVKKGATVLFKDGRTAEVIDNRKGICRMVKIAVLGQPNTFDRGDEYVYKWKEVLQNDVRYQVVLPPKLQEQADRIRMFMG